MIHSRLRQKLIFSSSLSDCLCSLSSDCLLSGSSSDCSSLSEHSSSDCSSLSERSSSDCSSLSERSSSDCSSLSKRSSSDCSSLSERFVLHHLLVFVHFQEDFSNPQFYLDDKVNFRSFGGVASLKHVV